MGLDEIWDSITEAFSSFFSFDWIGDIGETFSTMFTEFSTPGLIQGLITAGISFVALRKIDMIRGNPLYFVMGLTLAFVIGYISGSHYWRDR